LSQKKHVLAKDTEIEKGGFRCVVHGGTGVVCQKNEGNCMFSRQILSAQPPAAGNNKYKKGIITHVGENSPIHYFKYNLKDT
jgi:hypothetical protein